MSTPAPAPYVQLAFDLDALPDPDDDPRRGYSAATFRAAVAGAMNLAGVCRALGIVACGGNYESVRRYAARLGVDLAHLGPRAPSYRRPELTRERLCAALNGARTRREVLERLGVAVDEGNPYRWLDAQFERFGLPPAVTAGRGCARGRKVGGRVPVETYLVVGPPRRSTSDLRRRLLDDGLLERRCAICHRADWRGDPIPLELDHINGDRDDSRLENLRVLCPNCHAQTPTYRGRNIGRSHHGRGSAGA